MRTLALVALAASLSTAHAQDLPAVGTPAPDLAFEATVGSDAPGDLAGRARVVDFWATWCAPCVAAMPHLDSLAEAFAGEPVAFLAATDEGRVLSAGLPSCCRRTRITRRGRMQSSDSSRARPSNSG